MKLFHFEMRQLHFEMRWLHLEIIVKSKHIVQMRQDE